MGVLIEDVTSVWKLSITDANDLQSNCGELSTICLGVERANLTCFGWVLFNFLVYTLNIWRPSPDLYGLLREGPQI